MEAITMELTTETDETTEEMNGGCSGTDYPIWGYECQSLSAIVPDF
ncbi:hypothetical protein [Halorussus salinus]|nr:hypothetical protein [Halorussus salinus]